MPIDRIAIRGVKNLDSLDIEFNFPDSRIIVITGKNGAGKTTIAECFSLLSDPNIFDKSSAEGSLTPSSSVSFNLEGFEPFRFAFNEKLRALDSTNRLPPEDAIISELSIPHGMRFRRHSRIAKFDSELRANIASSDYATADELIGFLNAVYASNKFAALKATKIKNDTFYFVVKDQDYYIREDHFSAGEYFLIQLHRLVNSGAKLIIIDELDVALDAVAQARLFETIKPILASNGSRLMVVSHSLAFMKTTDEDCLYYLENSAGIISLQARSYAYIKSDLFGFRGFDRYILVEDEVLERYIEFLLLRNSVCCHYRYVIIGVNGANQLQSLIQKNDRDQIFSAAINVLGVVDNDKFEEISNRYDGGTKIVSTGLDDIEKYVYLHRETLLPEVGQPHHQESGKVKRASKTFWKWLIEQNNLTANELYELVASSEPDASNALLEEIARFLRRR